MRILLVDDDPDMRLIASFSLGLDGRFEVLQAAGGREALERARRERPDAILMDAVMPDLDGEALLAKLREDPDFARIPVLFFTACSRPDEVERLLRLGARGVIAKPFDPATLGVEVEKALAG